MALAQIAEIEKLKLPERSANSENFCSPNCNQKFQIQNSSCRARTRFDGRRGIALPDGKPATEAALSPHQNLLHRGYIFLPEGEHGNVISFTPPLTITKPQLAKAVGAHSRRF
jgi:4-aminobutyrate aminotransferase-like enzyme